MTIRVLALALLAGFAVAQAAPPKKTPKTDESTTQQTPESLDVDAMARAKDEAAAPADADTPPPAEPPSEAPPAAAPAPEAAPAEAATPAETPPPADAPVATETPPPAEAPVATEAPAQTPETEKPAAEAAESPAETEERSLAASCVARAANLLDDAEKSDFGGATRDFDAKMRTDMPAPKLKQQWDSMAQFGKLMARGQSHVSSGQGYTLVMIPLIFEKTNLVAQIACGSDGRIAGFHVTQAPKPKF
jgi:hypothetical protein